MSDKTKKHILVVTGTRAEYGLLQPLMTALDEHERYSLHLIVTGMHTLDEYGNTKQLITDDGFTYEEISLHKHQTMIQNLSQEMKGIEEYVQKHSIDMCIVLGDRDEAFAASIVAGHHAIPVAHIHGGDKGGHLPDEYIRPSISMFSHIHFAASTTSAKRIKNIGEDPSKIYTVGAIGLDHLVQKNVETREILAEIYSLDPKKKRILVLQHPCGSDVVEYTYKEQFSPIRDILEHQDNEEYEFIVIYPNNDTGSDIMINSLEVLGKTHNHIHVFKNIPRDNYMDFLYHAQLMIGNSSSGIIETGCVGLPVLNIGGRQAGRERGANVIDVTYDASIIQKYIRLYVSKQKTIDTDNPYYTGGATQHIISILNQIEDFATLVTEKTQRWQKTL